MENLTLERELEIRYDITLKVDELIKELNDTIAFTYRKIHFFSESHFIKKPFIVSLLDFLSEEMQNTSNQLSLLCNIKRSTFLYLPELRPIDIPTCFDILNHISLLHYDNNLDNERELFNSQVMLLKCREMEYANTVGLDADAMINNFDKMRKRYSTDQSTKHDIMRTETCTPKDSFRDLINSSRNIPQIKIWNDSDHNLLDTFRIMKEQRMVERDILPLIDYLDRYDFLKTLMNEEISISKPSKNKSLKKQKYVGLLSSDKAKPYWQKLRKAKLVDKHNQPLNLSWSEMGYIAYNFAAVLGIDDQWKEFGGYWNMDKDALRSNYNRGLEYASLSNIIEKTKDIFN